MDRLLSLLQRCIQSPEILAQGAILLQEFEGMPGYAPALVQILSNPSHTGIATSQLAGIVLKNYIKTYWEASVSSEDKQVVRTQLIASLHLPQPKLQEEVSLALAAVVSHEFPDVWATCFQEVLKSVDTGSPASIERGLRAVLVIFQENDDRLCRATGWLISQLYPLLGTPQPQVVYLLGLKIIHQCLDKLCWADGVDPQLVHEMLGQSWPQVLAGLVDLLDTASRSTEIRRLVLRVLTVFYRDFSNYSQDALVHVVKPVWILMYSTLPLYFDHCIFSQEVGEKSDLDDSDFGVEGMSIQLLELVSSLALRPSVMAALPTELEPLVQTVATYLFMTRDQQQRWHSDPNQFIQDEDKDENSNSVRSCCLALLSELVEQFREPALKALIGTAEGFLTLSSSRVVWSNQEEIQELVQDVNEELLGTIRMNEAEFRWKAREAAVLLLGRSVDDIRAYNVRARKSGIPLIDFSGVFDSIIRADLENSQVVQGYEYLKGRALWCTARMAEMLTNDPELCVKLFTSSALCLDSRLPLAVRLSSCLAVSKLAKKIDGQDERVKAVLPHLFRSLTGLLDEASSETLQLVLETFLDVSMLNAEFTTHGPLLASDKLLGLYCRYYGEASMGSIILALIRHWSDIPGCIKPLSDTFVPFVMNLLVQYPSSLSKSSSVSSVSTIDSRTDAVFVLPSSLDIIRIFVRKCRPDSDEGIVLLRLLPSLIEISLKSDDLSLLLHSAACLRAYVACMPSQILHHNLGPKLIEAASKMLDPTLNESCAVHLGYFMVQLFARVSPRVDEDLLVGCLNKVHRSKMPSIVQGIVLVFARLIHSHSSEIISFMSNLSLDRRVGLKVLLDKWLIHQPLIRGKYTKNATIAALARMFTLKDNRLENLLVVGFNPSHSKLSSEVLAPFKILSTLIRCLDNESKIPQRKARNEALGAEGEFETIVEGGGLGFGGAIDYDEDERLDTVEDAQDDEILGDPMSSLKDNLLAEVHEDYDMQDFKIPERKDKGLGDYETGSECLMSDMLDFDYDDGDELGEDFYEDDLYTLGDWYASLNLQSFLLDFFNNLIERDRDYLRSCMKHLLPEDVALFKKHFTF